MDPREVGAPGLAPQAASPDVRVRHQLEVLVRFEDEPTGRDVRGTVREPGRDDAAVPFHGWLQLLSHLEDLSARVPRTDDLARRRGRAPDEPR